MLILTDATAASEGSAGIVTYVAGLLRGWRDAGFDDRWVLQGPAGLAGVVTEQVEGQGEVVRSRSDGTLARIAVREIALPRLTRRHRPDVVLCTTPVVPRRLPVPAVAVVHDLRHLTRPQDFGRFQNRYRRRAWPAGMQRAARLIADSERTRQDLVGNYPFTEPKIRTVLLGSDHVPAGGPPGQGGHGIAFARWANKRPDFAVETWARLKEMEPGLDRRLHVVGAGSDAAAGLRSLAAARGIAGLVVIEPFLPEDRYWELFRSAGVVLFPSHFEGFGLPVLEAMRLGVPVVTWRDPAVAEVAGDCVAYAEPAPEDFARHAQAALARDAATGYLLKRAAARAATLTWRRTAEQTRSVLVEALAAASAGAGRAQPGR